MTSIPPPEKDFAVLNIEDAVIPDGDPVGISAEILENTFGTAKWRFAVNNPFFFIELFPEKIEVAGCLEMTDRTIEHQNTVFKTILMVKTTCRYSIGNQYLIDIQDRAFYSAYRRMQALINTTS